MNIALQITRACFLRRHRPLVGALLGCVAGAAIWTGGVAGAADIVVDPDYFHIGSYSTLDPLDSDIVSGSTTIRVEEDGYWEFQARLEGPFRRLSDGHELPLDRISEIYPHVPGYILSLGSHTIRTGTGPREFNIEWLDLGTGLQTYLREEDPAGTYEVVLLGRLINDGHFPITDWIPVTAQFEITPWVDLASSTLPDFEVPINQPNPVGDSQIVSVLVKSNTNWTLSLAAGTDLTLEGGPSGLPISTLSCCVLGSGLSWSPVNSGCLGVDLNPEIIVAGSPTFQTEEVPVFLRFEGSLPIELGTYDTSLLFEAVTSDVAP